MENIEISDYYNLQLENYSKKEINKIKASLRYNSIVSYISKDYKAPYCHFRIKEDSLLVYLDRKRIKSFDDKESPLKINFSDGHTRSTFKSTRTKSELTKVFFYYKNNLIKPNNNILEIYELNEENKQGRYLKYGANNLITKGFFKLLDHPRIDTIELIDYDTYEKSYEFKEFDQTWYKSGIWEYYGANRNLSKTEDFSDSLLFMPNHLFIDY